MVIDNDKITNEFKINLEDLGINYKRSNENISCKEMANKLKTPSEDFKKLAKLNTALLLLASKQTDDIVKSFENLCNTNPH